MGFDRVNMCSDGIRIRDDFIGWTSELYSEREIVNEDNDKVLLLCPNTVWLQFD